MASQEPQSPPPHLSQTPLHLQPTVVLIGPNPFVNSTVPTTMMTPITARFPPFNSNTNPSTHSESFNNDASVTVPSTTVEPCMKTVVEGSSSTSISASSANKRKRGRPRKHVLPQANDNHHLGSGQAQADPAPAALVNPAPAPDSSTAKKTRGRGRPRGSSKKRVVEVHGQAGSCLVSYLIDVNPGENIIAKLPSELWGRRESQLGVLHANGSVSTVSLHQSGSIATYEGHFRIISLSCSLKLFKSRKGFKRTIDWLVGLEGSDSRHIGGLVVDKLIAASPVMVIMASFIPEDANASLKDWESESSAPSSQFAASGTPADANVQEQATSDQSTTGENNENIPLSTQGPVYNNDSQQ